VDALLGDASKARRVLGWRPEISFDDLVTEMVKHDLDLARRDALIKREGFKSFVYRE
jgi:GDPmannose 4,6-dehydratase